MWLLPSTHPLYYQFVRGCEGSIEDLKELSDQCEQSLMWKSKPFASQIWQRKWKRVMWIRYLYSRMLRDSQHEDFITKYTGSLADIRVSPSAMPETDSGPMTRGTFGRIQKKQWLISNPSDVSLRMYQGTYHLDSTLWSETFKTWAMSLKLDYTQRKKSGKRTSENGSLSLPSWPTPVASRAEYSNSHGKRKNKLPGCVLEPQNWHTPMVQDSRISGTTEYQLSKGLRNNLQLAAQVNQWPTATAANWRSGSSKQHRKNSRPLNEMVVLHDPGNISTVGKNLEQLNPAWVAQLMGITLERIFYVGLVIWW